MKNKLKTTTEDLNDSKLRNTRCEEIIREMRSKLSNKLKEVDQQNKMLDQQELKIEHLEDTVKSVRDELGASNKTVFENERTVALLRDEGSKKDSQISQLENNMEDMEDNLKVLLSEKEEIHSTVSLLFLTLVLDVYQDSKEVERTPLGEETDS